jgi:hypothetical protein
MPPFLQFWPFGQEPLPGPLDVHVVTHRCEIQVWFVAQWLSVAHVTQR